MPTLRSLLTPQELRLLTLVPVLGLPAPLAELLETEFASRSYVDSLLTYWLRKIPRTAFVPDAKHAGYGDGIPPFESPYGDYRGWLAWFVASNRLDQAGQIVARKRAGDIEMQRELTRRQLDRAGSDTALRARATEPAWLNRELGSFERAGGKVERPRATSRPKGNNPLSMLGIKTGKKAARTGSRLSPSTSTPARAAGRLSIGDLVQTPRGHVAQIIRIHGRYYYVAGSGASFFAGDLLPVEP